jgi:hypothetical protein
VYVKEVFKMDNNQETRTRRKRGTRTFAQEQKKLKLTSKAYLTKKNVRKLEKKKPHEAVSSNYCLGIDLILYVLIQSFYRSPVNAILSAKLFH